jgi:hypothetical protein
MTLRPKVCTEAGNGEPTSASALAWVKVVVGGVPEVVTPDM